MEAVQMDLPEPRKTRADQIREAFEKYHVSNPGVWELFEKFAMQVIGAGREHYSSAAIFQQIRWHYTITTSGEEVKINNNFAPYYARLFHAKHPQHSKFFRNRIMITKQQPACKPNIQVFRDPDDNEPYGYVCPICREPIVDPQPTEHTEEGLAHATCVNK
jgi:hypothetical protein